MLISDVQVFIEKLTSAEDRLNKIDLELLNALKVKFGSSKKDPDSLDSQDTCSKPLSSEDIAWIQQAFAQRWLKVKATKDDYTLILHEADVNPIWIEFAKKVAALSSVKKHPVLVLMPNLSNERDLDSGKTLETLKAEPSSIFWTLDLESGSKLAPRFRWHDTTAMLEKMKRGAPGASFGAYDETFKDRRSFHLEVIGRLKYQKYPQCYKGEKYQTVWEYVSEEHLPFWNRYGDCPKQVIGSLNELIQSYFIAITSKEKNFGLFFRALKNLADELVEVDEQDANCFYGTKLEIDGEEVYVIEILLDCLQNDRDLSREIQMLSNWTKAFHAALSIPDVDEWLEPSELCMSIGLLDFAGCSKLKSKALALMISLQFARQLRPVFIKQLEVIYAERWKIIKDTDYDYLRVESIYVNHNWIHLAGILAAYKLIPDGKNCYEFLIPSLQQKEEPLSGRPITSHSLRHYILAEDGKRLIYLYNVKHYHQLYGGPLYNHDLPEPRPLTPIEFERFKQADPRYYHYYIKHVVKEKDPAVSKRVVSAVATLAMKTVNSIGLIVGKDISKSQQEIAEEAYKEFLAFLETLPKKEVENFYKQRTVFRRREYASQVILSKVLAADDDKNGCIATYGQWWIKYVLDHDPNWLFCKALEESDTLDLHEMRLQSARKLYSEFWYAEHVDASEAVLRLRTICVLIVTRQFTHLPVSQKVVGAFGTTNRVSPDIYQLFDKLKSLSAKPVLHPQLVYAELLQLVKDACARDDSVSPSTDLTDAIGFLHGINNEKLFAKETATCFEPKRLMVSLWLLLADKNLESRGLIESILDKLMERDYSGEQAALSWISVNIEFQKLLQDKAFSPVDREKLLSKLRDKTVVVSDKQYSEARQAFLDARATSRLRIIYVLIMAREFTVLPFRKYTINAFGTTNNVSCDISLLFEKLHPWMVKSVLHPTSAYAELLKLVKDACGRKDYVTYWTRFVDTNDFLQKVDNEELFAKENLTCFEPKHLMIILWSLSSGRSIKSRALVEGFLDKLMKLECNAKPDQFKWIAVNIEFQKLLQNEKLPVTERDKLLSALRDKTVDVSEKQYLKAKQSFLIHRLAFYGLFQLIGRSTSGLFGSDPGSNMKLYNGLSSRLLEGLPTEAAAPNIVELLWQQVEKLTGQFAKSKTMMFDYLEMISLPSTVEPTPTVISQPPEQLIVGRL